jgi:hypothetical protein
MISPYFMFWDPRAIETNAFIRSHRGEKQPIGIPSKVNKSVRKMQKQSKKRNRK